MILWLVFCYVALHKGVSIHGRSVQVGSDRCQGSGLQAVITPLVLPHWESLLADHPDKNYSGYLLKGIKEGFWIGFDRGVKLASARKNMLSAVEHPEVVNQYLLKERKRGVLLGPFQRKDMPEVVISRFGVIPKGDQPGKWRLIVDLSHPEQQSANDGINSEWCSLTYVRVEAVVGRLLQLGMGAKMAKIDIKSAYRIVPVHPDDRHLLGMRWNDRVFVDAVLPFGLRSAPKIFNAIADAVEWIVREQGVRDVGTTWMTTSCVECQNRQTVQMGCSCWWKLVGVWVYHWQRKRWKDHALA